MSISLKQQAFEALDTAFAEQLEQRFGVFVGGMASGTSLEDAARRFGIAVSELKEAYAQAQAIIGTEFK